MQETKVTDPLKATGQDMLEQLPEELAPGESADLTLSLVVLIAETHQAIAVGNDGPLRRTIAIMIAAKMGHHLFPASHLLR
jgi:hypothetical protein